MARRARDNWPPTERLTLFVTRTDELLNEPAARDFGLRIGLTISAGVNQPLSTTRREPPEDAIRSYLLLFRQFVSNDEPIHVNTVHGLLYQHISGDTMKAKLAERSKAWKQANKTGHMRLELNGTVIGPTEALDLWINGHYFHNDYEKAARLRRMTGLDGELVRHAALDLVVEGTRYVEFLAWAIVAGHREGLLHI